MKFLTAAVLLLSVLALSRSTVMHSSSLTLRRVVPAPELRSTQHSALRLRGGADLQAEVNVGDEAKAAAEQQGAAGGEKRCPHGVPMDSAEECHRCEVLAFMQRSAFVLQKTGGSANSTTFATLWGVCFPNLPAMTPEASRTHVAKALNATGYFDVEPIAGSEDKLFTFNEKAARMCPHGVPLNSTQRCALCEKISFLQRSARIVGEAGGSINSTDFSVAWNQQYNATTEMTPEAAATKVAQILAESGFFLVIDTDDDNVKTFALRPQAQACPHGVRRDQGDSCQSCSRIRFIQACAHVLEQGGGKLTSAEFSVKWAEIFPNQPKIPPETCAKEIAQAMLESGIFKITPTGNGDEKEFEFEEEEAIVAYKKRLDDEIAAAQAARQGPAQDPSAATPKADDAPAAAAAAAPEEAASPQTATTAQPASSGKVGLGALLD